MKYKYYNWEETPLVFYRVLLKLLWIPLVIGVFLSISYIQNWVSVPGYYKMWVFWVDMAFYSGKLVSVFLAIYWLTRREWSGALSLFIYLSLIVLYKCFESFILEEDKLYSIIIYLIAGLLICSPVFIYFMKRRPIFSPTIQKISLDVERKNEKPEETPVLSEAKEICEKEEQKEQSEQTEDPKESCLIQPGKRNRSNNWKKEQLYICCPDCGSLCLYEDKQCPCGHKFSTKLEPDTKKRNTKRWIPVVVSVVILMASAVGWVFTYKNSEKKDYADPSQDYSKLEEDYKRVLNAYHFSLDKVNKLESELDFYWNAVGIVGDSSDDYHVFGCEKLKDSESIVCTDIMFLRDNDIEPCECVNNHFENYSSNMIIDYLSEQYVNANKSFIILGE